MTNAIPTTQTRQTIILTTNHIASNRDEWYQLQINAKDESIKIIGQDKSGLFYGIQSLISLAEGSNMMVPDADIVDEPRYKYRGMHVDVARNFQNKDSILKLLETMATYKMNKLHLHLTDDEGWRLEIPGLPELTQVFSLALICLQLIR